MVAISGEIPANLPEKIVGSKSYATSLITDLKKKGYLLLRYRDGVRGYVLGKEEKLSFAALSSGRGPLSYRCKRNKPCEIRTGKTTAVAPYEPDMDLLFVHGNLIFATEKPKIFTRECYVETSLGIYYGSQELKQRSDQVKGSRACGLYIKRGEVFVVYNSMGNLMRWSKKWK